MELFRRKDGRSPYWHFDTTDEATGKRVRKSTGEVNLKAARIVAATMAAALGKAGQETTVGAALAAYVAHMKTSGKSSWADARLKADKTVGTGGADRWAGRFALPADLLLSKLDERRLTALRSARMDEGNKPGTIAAELRILRAACLHAADEGYTPAAVRKWKVPPPVRKMRYLSPDEVEQVAALLEQDERDLFLTLVLTGGRWNEVAKMTWGRINSDEGSITLWGFKGSKERTVPMVGRLADIMVRRYEARTGPYVFPGQDGTSARFGPSRAIKRAMDKAGLNAPEIVEQFGRATTHSLRHTFASWLRQRGLGLDEIQPLLGHADLQTTQIYAKVRASTTLQRARAALEGDGTPADP